MEPLPPFLQTLILYFWIFPVLMGFFLLARGAGTRLLGLGLLTLNIWDISNFLVKQEMLTYEDVTEYRTAMIVVAITGNVLLLLGIYKLISGGGAGGSVSSRTAPAADMTSLLIPRNDSNTISRALEARDAALAVLAKAAQESRVRYIPQKSQAHDSGIWARLDIINHPEPTNPTLSLRTVVEIFVERLDFHVIDLVYTVRVTVGAKSVSHSGLLGITDKTAERILDYIETPGKKLNLTNKVRLSPWQLWRPRNKVQRFRSDWLATGLGAISMVLLFVPPIGTLLGIAGFVILAFRGRRLRTHTLTTGKPNFDPRILVWMDSWQVTVRDLGRVLDATVKGITDRLRKDAPSELRVTLERTGYWSTDGRVERDQYVVRYRRALGFIQTAPYGTNLYVSWECHLNLGAWAEEVVAGGVDRETGLHVVANRTVFGRQTINEYDLADANFLTEWMHQAVKTELQVQIAEHHIDQEIDFTINRESRKEALDAGRAKPGAPPAAGQKKNRFSRVG